MKKISLICVVKNEIEGIKYCFSEIDTNLFENIIFLDGNSQDGSREYIENNINNTILINQTEKMTISDGLIEIISNCTSEYLIFFQPDGNCDPSFLERFIHEIYNHDYDLIIASRYKDNAKSYDDNFVSKLGNYLFTKLVNILFYQKFTDVMVGYRACKRSTMIEFDISNKKYYQKLEKYLKTSLSWDPLMTAVYSKYNLDIKEFPASEPARIGGVVKKNSIKWGIAYLLQILFVKFFFKKNNF